MLTEDEAKTKWCPLARVGGPMQTEAEGTTANRWPGQAVADEKAADYRCMASACMAWREASSVKGYCGAFGTPAGVA